MNQNSNSVVKSQTQKNYVTKINPENTQAWKSLNEHFAQNDFDPKNTFQENAIVSNSFQ